MLGFLGRPFATVILSAVIISLLAVLPVGHMDQSGSTLGGLLARDSGRSWGSGHLAYVARGEQSGRLIDINADSADEYSRLVMSRPKDMVEFSVFSGRKLTGFLFLTRETEFAEIWPVFYDRDALSDAEIDAAWPAISRWSQTRPMLALHNPSVVADLLAGGATRTRVLWRGYVSNGLFLLALTLWITSLRWIPDLARSRRDRRRAKGLCGTCRYDLRGDLSGVCPECGNRNVPGS